MKSKDKKLLHEKSLNELKKMVSDIKEVIFLEDLNKTQNKLKNTRSTFLKRKDVARMLTIIRQKELEEKDAKSVWG